MGISIVIFKPSNAIFCSFFGAFICASGMGVLLADGAHAKAGDAIQGASPAPEEALPDLPDATAIEYNPFEAMLNDDLIYKVTLGSAKDVGIILGKGASADAKNDNGQPALHIAAERLDDTSEEIMTLLLDAGANIDIKNAHGMTPLHTAIRSHNSTAVLLLLNRGANYHMSNATGTTPLQEAEATGTPEIVDLIKQALAIEKHRFEEARSENKLKEMIYKFAYYHCSVAYLRYYYSTDPMAQQRADLSAESFTEREKRLIEYQQTLEERFGTKRTKLTKVAKGSRDSITRLLDSMVSVQNRRKLGFGTQDDMYKRCHDIAVRWEVL